MRSMGGFLRRMKRMSRTRRRYKEHGIVKAATTCDVSEATPPILTRFHSYQELSPTNSSDNDYDGDDDDRAELLLTMTSSSDACTSKRRHLCTFDERVMFRRRSRDEQDEEKQTTGKSKAKKVKKEKSMRNKDTPRSNDTPSKSPKEQAPPSANKTLDENRDDDEENVLALSQPDASSSSPRHDDGLVHIYDDDLATLYEESLRSEETDGDAAEQQQQRQVIRMDETSIRARWEYVMQVMTNMGQCEGSIYSSIAGMLPTGSSRVDRIVDKSSEEVEI